MVTLALNPTMSIVALAGEKEDHLIEDVTRAYGGRSASRSVQDKVTYQVLSKLAV
ncbi:MAG: hypothetical protein ACI9SB_001499 [Candidatus Azotimanducaceae bacterium]|jgi:hypothetical protein